MNDVVCADIMILDDDALEGEHTFTVVLDSNTLVTLQMPFAASVTIADNEGRLHKD